ncbi:MAG: precorrin-6y C5,15-methyltransferase (decarboxylating) subunit CbiE [Pyramidobacter sp.]|jgi:precorrin-6Y C5,15-methyltransferase (decarboxylating)
MRHKLYVIGAGPGSAGQLTQDGREAISKAGLVVAARRHKPLAAGRPVVELENFDETFRQIDEALNSRSVAVIVSGDTGIYSLLPLLARRFPDEDLAVLPGISSVQTLCALLKTTWNDAVILSGHGKAIGEAKILDAADQNGKTLFFCGPQWNPARLSSLLADNGMDFLRLAVGERLSYDDQKLTVGRPSELARGSYDDLSLVMIENPTPWTKPARRLLDDEFIRTEAPMTRQVVRSAVLDELRLEKNSVLWDLGAGTGSVSVAGALICDDGLVCAVEKNPDAAELIGRNAKKFHRHNIKIFCGDNLKVLPSLPRPTHVFVGGSGAELPELLKTVAALGGNIRVVVSAVSLKTFAAAAEILSGPMFTDFDAVQTSVSRAKRIGSTLIMAAQNSVTIFTGLTASGKEGC